MYSDAVLIFAGVAAVFFAGVAVFVWAWRGRRVDDHPLCRGCGFDLTGRPESSSRCSECGRDVTSARAIRVGHRRRRLVWAAVAGVVVVGMLGGAVVVGVAAYRQVDLYRYEPEWWLARQVMFDSSRGERAAAEIIRRTQYGDLQAKTLGFLVDRILALQADPKAAWRAPMGDLIEALHSIHGVIGDDKWVRYLKQQYHLRLVAKAQIGAGESLPIDVYSDDRCGSFTFSIMDAMTGRITNEHGKRYEFGETILSVMPRLMKSQTRSPVGTLVIPTAYVGKPGEHPRLKVSLQVQIAGPDLLHEGKPIATCDYSAEVTTEVLAPGTPSVRANSEPHLESKLRAAISIEQVDLISFRGGIILSVGIHIKDCPSDLAYRSSISVFDREPLDNIGNCVVKKGQTTSDVLMFVLNATDSLPTTATLVLTPDVELARSSAVVTHYASVPLQFEIKVPPPTYPGASRPAPQKSAP